MKKKAIFTVKKKLDFFFRIVVYDRPYGTNFHYIHAPNIAPKDLIPTREREKLCSWNVGGVTIKFDYWDLYPPVSFTGGMQPNISEIISDLKKVTFTTARVLILLILLQLLLRGFFGKQEVL